MNPAEFAVLRAFLKKRSGLALGDDKLYLAEARLKPLVKEFRLTGFGHLVGFLGQIGHESLSQRVTEAMTVNETFFFRDQQPFEQLVKIMLPALTAKPARPRPLRIWCAACSTGQEPYSIAMTLKELGESFYPWTFEILATDLSRDVVETAKAGVYSQFDVQRGLPADLRRKYFAPSGLDWRANDDLRGMISFQPFNLMDCCRRLGVFDIVFCRNVLIYFDVETKTRIVERIAPQVRPGGYFVVGGSESLLGLTTALSVVSGARSLYTPPAVNFSPHNAPAASQRVLA